MATNDSLEGKLRALHGDCSCDPVHAPCNKLHTLRAAAAIGAVHVNSLIDRAAAIGDELGYARGRAEAFAEAIALVRDEYATRDTWVYYPSEAVADLRALAERTKGGGR